MPEKKRTFTRSDLFYIAAIALCALFLMKDAVFGAKVFISKAADCYFSNYSFAYFFKDAFRNFMFPLWYPYSGCGTPIGIVGKGGFDTLYILSLFFSVDFAWNLRIFLITFLAGACTYIYCRKLQLVKFAALFASIVFMLSAFTRSFTSNYIESSIFLLPLILIFAENYIKERNTFWMSMLGLAIAFLYLDSNFQLFFYVSLFLFLYILVRMKSWKTIFPFIIAFGICGFHFFRQLELANLCDRPVFNFITLLLPQYLATAIFPFLFESPFRPEFNFFFNNLTAEIFRKVLHSNDFYYIYLPFVGVTSLFFAFLANRKKYFVKLYAITTVFVIVFWLTFPALTVILKYIPFVNKLTAIDRLGLLYTFPLAVLAAFGVERFLTEKVDLRKINLFFSSICGFVVAILLAIRLLVHLKRDFITNLFRNYIENNIVGNPHHLASRDFYLERVNHFFSFINSWTDIFSPSILLSVIFAVLLLLAVNFYNRKILLKRPFKICLITILLAELFIFSSYNMVRTASPAELKFSYKLIDFLKQDKDIFRIMAIQDDAVYEKQFPDRMFLAPDSSGMYGISTIESYFNLYIGRYYQLCKSFMKTHDKHVNAIIAGNNGNFDLQLADLMNVKYFLTYGGVNLSFPVAYKDEMFTLYRNTNCLPRAFMAYDYEVIPDKEKVLSRMKQLRGNFGKVVILESALSGISADKSNGQKKNKVDILKYTPHLIDIQVFTQKPGLLVLSEAYYPGWKAFVDGYPAKIYIADYTFRAIVLPEGEHKVRFIFSPFSFKIGLAITGIFLLIIFILCVKPVKI